MVELSSERIEQIVLKETAKKARSRYHSAQRLYKIYVSV